MKTGSAGTLILGLLVAAGAQAREIWSAGDASFGLSGSVREVVTGTHGTSAEVVQDALLMCPEPALFPDCLPQRIPPDAS